MTELIIKIQYQVILLDEMANVTFLGDAETNWSKQIFLPDVSKELHTVEAESSPSNMRMYSCNVSIKKMDHK